MMGLILVVPLTTESGTIEVLHWVLQSDGCTNGVLIASNPVDIAVMDSVGLRDMIRVPFEETPRLVLLLGAERNGSSCGWLGHALLIAVALRFISQGPCANNMGVWKNQSRERSNHATRPHRELDQAKILGF